MAELRAELRAEFMVEWDDIVDTRRPFAHSCLRCSRSDLRLPNSEPCWLLQTHTVARFRGNKPQAYSTVKVGATARQFSDMVSPLRRPRGRTKGAGTSPAVFFAGEHTCAAYQGYVHGGYKSGHRAASEALRALGKPLAAAMVYSGPCVLPWRGGILRASGRGGRRG